VLEFLPDRHNQVPKEGYDVVSPTYEGHKCIREESPDEVKQDAEKEKVP
jgi:hypothetical protein